MCYELRSCSTDGALLRIKLFAGFDSQGCQSWCDCWSLFCSGRPTTRPALLMRIQLGSSHATPHHHVGIANGNGLARLLPACSNIALSSPEEIAGACMPGQLSSSCPSMHSFILSLFWSSRALIAPRSPAVPSSAPTRCYFDVVGRYLRRSGFMHICHVSILDAKRLSWCETHQVRK